MKMNGMKVPLETVLLACMVDRLSLLVWVKTEDGQNGLNRPKSIAEQLLGENKENEAVGFDTPEEFEEARKRILERSG